MKKYPLPDATRHVSLLTQLLDVKFNPENFEQDFKTWETFKVKYEKQTGTELPDSVLVATLLNKTSGPLQRHLRLNARNLTIYEDIRATILEYHQSRHILTGANSSSQGPAPMDIGGRKGRKGFGKGGFGHFKGKKGKGKGKGKKGKFRGGKNPHVNFHDAAMAKGKGKRKGNSKLRGQPALVCWTCGKSGHVASQCRRRCPRWTTTHGLNDVLHLDIRPRAWLYSTAENCAKLCNMHASRLTKDLMDREFELRFRICFDIKAALRRAASHPNRNTITSNLRRVDGVGQVGWRRHC